VTYLVSSPGPRHIQVGGRRVSVPPGYSRVDDETAELLISHGFLEQSGAAIVPDPVRPPPPLAEERPGRGEKPARGGK
jgi:hypothetical protein